MNNPEYILTDEMVTVAAAVKAALALPVLNFQYGFIDELNETLIQMEKDPAQYAGKFPLIWLEEPFTINRDKSLFFGSANVNLYVINSTTKTWKAAERMENNYKPILYPIYRELLKQICLSDAFAEVADSNLKHTVMKGYYWGEAQRSVLNDAVDCLKIGSLELLINTNTNCVGFKNF